jgi:hypothetical protein
MLLERLPAWAAGAGNKPRCIMIHQLDVSDVMYAANEDGMIFVGCGVEYADAARYKIFRWRKKMKK